MPASLLVASVCVFPDPCSQFDLYSKADNPPDPKELTEYYQSLLDKYLPGALKW